VGYDHEKSHPKLVSRGLPETPRLREGLSRVVKRKDVLRGASPSSFCRWHRPNKEKEEIVRGRGGGFDEFLQGRAAVLLQPQPSLGGGRAKGGGKGPRAGSVKNLVILYSGKAIRALLQWRAVGLMKKKRRVGEGRGTCWRGI